MRLTFANAARRSCCAVLAGLFCVLAVPAAAQSWPAKPVRVIVPFPPGGASDALARMVAQKMGEQLGQSFVVENRPGAASTIGIAEAAKAQANAYKGDVEAFRGLHQALTRDGPLNVERVLSVANKNKIETTREDIAAIFQKYDADQNAALELKEFAAWWGSANDGLSVLLRNALSEEQYRLYELIWRRFVACQMAHKQYDLTTVRLERSDRRTGAVVRASGSVVVFDGYLKLVEDIAEDDEEARESEENASVRLERYLAAEVARTEDSVKAAIKAHTAAKAALSAFCAMRVVPANEV